MGYNPPQAPGAQATAAAQAVSPATDAVFPVSVSDLFLTGQATQTALVNNILPAASGSAGTDCATFRSAAVQVNSTGTAGAYIFEGSNDNSNWVTVPVFNQAVLTGTPIVAAITASVASIIYILPITFRYLRLRISTAITGGSIQAITRFSDEAFSPAVGQIGNATAANLQATIANLAAAAAGTDSMSTPTTAPVLADDLQYNGSSWDRVRNNIAVVGDASAAKTVSVAGATQTNFNGRGVICTIIFGAVTGTTPTLAVQAQYSPDGGTTWINYGPQLFAAATPASGNTWVAIIYPTNVSDDTTQTLAALLTAGASPLPTAVKSLNAPLPRLWRLNYTVAGTTPSITFAMWTAYIN